MKVVVCGSRDWTWQSYIYRRICQLESGTTIIEGGARGADEIVSDICDAFGTFFEHIQVIADWDTHGKAAGFKRNLEMLNMKPDLVIAFSLNGSRGTEHTVYHAKKRGIPVEEHRMTLDVEKTNAP